MTTVKLMVDAQPLLDCLAELQLYADLDVPKLPLEVIDSLVNLFESPEQLIRFQVNRTPTSGADKVSVQLNPSDSLLGLCLTLRTGDVKFSGIKHDAL
jgi:hypothetical protein